MLIVKIVIVLAIFYFLYISESLSFKTLGTVGTNTNVVWLTAIMLILSTFIVGLRLFLLLRAVNIPVTATRSIGVTFIAQFTANIGLGALLSEGVRLTYLSRDSKHGWAHAASILVIDKIFGAIGLLSLVTVTLIVLNDFESPITLKQVSTFLILLSLVLISGAMLGPRLIGPAQQALDKVGQEKLAEILIFFSRTIGRLKNSPLELSFAILLSLLGHIISIYACVYLSIIMTQNLLSTQTLTLATALGQLANTIPLTPAGIGIGETVFAFTCRTLSNVNFELGFATIFLMQRVLNVFSSLPGLIIFLFLKIKK